MFLSIDEKIVKATLANRSGPAGRQAARPPEQAAFRRLETITSHTWDPNLCREQIL